MGLRGVAGQIVADVRVAAITVVITEKDRNTVDKKAASFLAAF